MTDKSKWLTIKYPQITQTQIPLSILMGQVCYIDPLSDAYSMYLKCSRNQFHGQYIRNVQALLYLPQKYNQSIEFIPVYSELPLIEITQSASN